MKHNIFAGIICKLKFHQKDFLIALSDEAKRRKVTVKTHLHINTGMNRDGVDSDKAVDFMKEYGKLSISKW